MNLFEFTKCDTLVGYGERGIKIDVEIMKWESCSDKKSKIIIHARKLYGALEVLYCTVVSSCTALHTAQPILMISAYASVSTLVHAWEQPQWFCVCVNFVLSVCPNIQGPRFSVEHQF